MHTGKAGFYLEMKEHQTTHRQQGFVTQPQLPLVQPFGFDDYS